MFSLKKKSGNGMDEGVDLGPLTTAKRLEEIEKLVETTKKEGAKVLMGGQRPRISLIFVFFVATYIEPAHIKRVILPNA